MTKKIILIVAVLWVAALVVAIKLIYYPAAKDAYFAMNQRSLRQVPSGLVIIRPTHFALAVYHKGVMYSGGRGQSLRMMGRDVPLRDIIAAAWGENAGRVVMPPGAPTNNFDFLVTVAEPREQLQKAIHHEFNYVADKETRETDVLAVKVENPALPGVSVSASGEKQNVNFKHGLLYFTHMRFKEITPGFEQFLKTPVVDESGLTNYYDFTLAWNNRFYTQLRSESTARTAMDKILAQWGLGLEPDSAAIEMLIVKKEY